MLSVMQRRVLLTALLMNKRPALRIVERLTVAEQRLGSTHNATQMMGRVVRNVGLTLEAKGCRPALGTHCLVFTAAGSSIETEVVGFSEDAVVLMPFDSIEGLQPGARVMPMNHSHQMPVGSSLLGRVVNGRGQALDHKGDLLLTERVSLKSQRINPLYRAAVCEPLDVGIRAINGLLTVGRGQRLGLFAGSGVGKSVLLAMMARFTQADVIVVGMIGERGREVKEFIDQTLGEAGLKKSIVVASPADDPPALRVQAAQYASSIAEYFRDQGKQVLLLLDSLTRYAQAAREIAIASGELPATKGYSPSVFYRLTELVERAGNGLAGGGITAFYTVLTESDEVLDPIADAARAILDGHIVLSRSLAEAGVYPAIDIERSISRTMTQCVDATWMQSALGFKRLYAHYQSNIDLIKMGAYQQGADVLLDQAVKAYPKMLDYLNQSMKQAVSLNDSAQQIRHVSSE